MKLNFNPVSSTPHPDITIQPTVELLAPDRHLHRVERILHNKVCIKFIYSLDDNIDIRLHRFCEEQEFCACERLETRQPEVGGLEDFETRGSQGEIVGRILRDRVLGREGDGDDAAGYGVNAVKGAGEDQKVV